MKIRLSLLLALALTTGACQRTRLSPTVLTPPVSETPAVEKVAAEKAHKSTDKANDKVADSAQASKPVAKVEAKASKSEEAARLAAKKKRLAAARRAQAKKQAIASLEAGRQLLREEQNQSALKAFREAVRLNSSFAEAWMGIAFVSERTGNTKDALEAFKEAKKLWGM